MQANTIDEVLTTLEAIIEESITTNNRAGYFAALYHKVTYQVKLGIKNGEFEDGARMEQLDVMFANRYLGAYEQWKNNIKPTGSWEIAFTTVGKRRALVLQHLLLGINAHINLDLGIAAVQTTNGASLPTIQKDFAAINSIIASLTYEVMNEITRVSPLLSLMGLHATNYNAIIIQFSIANARDGAWCFAEDLHSKQGAVFNNCITDRDKTITKLAEGLVSAKGILRFTLWLIHLFEWKRPSKVINALYTYKKKDFTKSDIEAGAKAVASKKVEPKPA
ncbi:DUF5995 family protein [Chitinophagaceae bacterium 26-R-25]|nr:DUF5995 family protein [Chitinophagaceae bacterium 26-R-25]